MESKLTWKIEKDGLITDGEKDNPCGLLKYAFMYLCSHKCVHICFQTS